MSKNVDQYKRRLEEAFAKGADAVEVKESVDYVGNWLKMDSEDRAAAGAGFRDHAYKVATYLWKWNKTKAVLLAGEVLSQGLADEKFSRLAGSIMLEIANRASALPTKKHGKRRGRPKSVPEIEIAQAYTAAKKAREEAGTQANPSREDVIEQLKVHRVHVELKNGGKSGSRPAGYTTVGQTALDDAIARYNALPLSDIEGMSSFRRLKKAFEESTRQDTK
jgi:hypothetical protein